MIKSVTSCSWLKRVPHSKNASCNCTKLLTDNFSIHMLFNEAVNSKALKTNYGQTYSQFQLEKQLQVKNFFNYYIYALCVQICIVLKNRKTHVMNTHKSGHEPLFFFSFVSLSIVSFYHIFNNRCC